MRLSYRSRLDLRCESFILAGRSSCGTRRVCGRRKNGDTRAVEAIPFYTGNLEDVRGLRLVRLRLTFAQDDRLIGGRC